VAARALPVGAFHDPRPRRGAGLRGIKSDRRAVWVFLHAEGLSFKKTVLPAEQTRPDIARKRARWKAHQGRIDPARLVFLNETWIKTNMAPLRGWGPRGRRLEARVPHGRWKTLTFIAALRSDRVKAPWVIDGPINGELFTLYVEKALVPTLRPGDLVILDNLGSHKGASPVGRSGPRAPTSCSSRPTVQTSTRSSSSSPSSSTSSARPNPAPSRRAGGRSAPCWTRSPQPSAPTILPTPDMLPCKRSGL
jgi:hypothetical protein